MKMPIVSMNKMAMNESVATTCCYREVPTASVVYWEVLHGGWIGNGYTEELEWRSPSLKNSVFGGAVPYDFTGSNADRNTAIRTALQSCDAVRVTDNDGTSWFYNYKGITGLNAMGFAQEMANDLEFSVDMSTCDHKTTACAYRFADIAYRNNYHFDATSAHADVTAWAKGHAVKQFAS